MMNPTTISNTSKDLSDIAEDLEAIFKISYDVLFVSDAEGVALRVSSASNEIWGVEPEELIGRSVHELERDGVFSPSVTKKVLEQKKQVTLVQQTRTGRKLMCVGKPIFKDGKIVKIVNASKDITAIDKLQEEINTMKELIIEYRKEMSLLQEEKTQKIGGLIYRSKVMENVMSLVKKTAVVDSTVLITGESGVGKEIIANTIHQLSSRVKKAMMKINCAAIPDSLLESELFGYESGAFTGASKQGKPGLFELADGGTLFLDEIGDMSLTLQSKLLRLLQEREVRRIGGNKQRQFDVRVISATNKDLHAMVNEKKFREDLYYRLNVMPIKVPPLRERKEDIIQLTQHFIKEFSDKFDRELTLTTEILDKLEQYYWPGNIRELKNLVERWFVTEDSASIMSPLVNFQTNNSERQPGIDGVQTSPIFVNAICPLKEATTIVEEQLLRLAKEKYHTFEEIAKALKVNQSTISRKFQKYDL